MVAVRGLMRASSLAYLRAQRAGKLPQIRTIATSIGTQNLREWFPWVKPPVLVSAPMLYVSNGRLAAEVSNAGGLGMIPGGYDFSSPDNAQMGGVDKLLQEAHQTFASDNPAGDISLPVGVGFVLAHPSVRDFAKNVIPMLQRHKLSGPVWLFAPHPESNPSPLPSLIEALHDAKLKAAVQVGTVAAAREALRASADVLVAQGGDAGGHQFAKVAGTIALVPEVRDAIEAEGRTQDVALLAAGGIVDGRGVAAALALGADGVVMGTRFIVAHETSAPEWRQQAILRTEDGGLSTVKSTFHDKILGTTVWPAFYDGRAIVTKIYDDHIAGMPVEENTKRYNEAKAKGDGELLVTWSGTAVGLVRKKQTARDIVNEVRSATVDRIEQLNTRD